MNNIGFTSKGLFQVKGPWAEGRQTSGNSMSAWQITCVVVLSKCIYCEVSAPIK